MRNLFPEPSFIDKYTSFIIEDTPVIVLFSDFILKLKKHSIKVSCKKYKIHLFYVDEVYSCYMTIEIFASFHGNLIVECLRRDGSRELFHQIFQWLSKDCIPSIKIVAEKDIFIAIVDKIEEEEVYMDIEKQLYEQIAIHCKAIWLDFVNLKKFKFALTMMLQSNEIDLLRWGCIILDKLRGLFELEMLEWKSILCMQYQLLPFDSIFTAHLLEKIPLLLG